MITFNGTLPQSAQMISADIPIISTHQIPTYEEVLNFAYQIYQQSKVQQQDLKVCQSIIQQIKPDNDILKAENTVWQESFYELQDSHTDLENKCTELDLGVKDRDETISQLRNENQRLRDKIHSYMNGGNNGQRSTNPTTRRDDTTPRANHSETTELHSTLEGEPQSQFRELDAEGQNHSGTVRENNRAVEENTGVDREPVEAPSDNRRDAADYQRAEKSPTNDTGRLSPIGQKQDAFNALQQENTQLRQENHELKEQVAQRGEAIQNKDRIIERNHKEYDAEIMRQQATIDRLQGDVTHLEQEWASFYALCANEDLESSEKLYMWQCRRYVLSLRSEVTEPVHACLEVMSSKIGMKRDAPRRIMRNLNERCAEPLFFIDSEKKTKENGEMRTNVTMRLAAIMQNPADVRKTNGKEHGGKPDRKCPKDGSENLDQFRLQHCRDCDDVAFFKLPGTRADADIISTMNAVAKEAPIYKNLQDQLEQALKHLASACNCHTNEEGERETQETAAIKLAESESAPVAETAQKQDASADLEPIEDNLQRNTTSSDSAASCKMINPATCQCCEGIDRGYAPIHRCYNCGAYDCYEWNHLRRRWVCTWCGAQPAF
jgi:hypothetical protein